MTGGKGGLAHKEISIFPVNAATAFRVTGSVGGISVTFLLDTGSAVTLVRRDLWDQIGSGATLRPCEHRLVGVDGSPLKIQGSAQITFQFGGVDFVTTVIVGDSLTTEAILGLDFLQEHRCTVDIGSKQLRVSGHKLVIPLHQSAASPCIGRVGVEMADSVQLPAYSELEVMARAVTPIEGNTWLIEGMKMKRSPVQIARALVIPRSERVPVRMLNPTAEPVQVPKGMVVAEMELVEDPPEVVESEIGVMSVEQSGELSESFLKKIAEDSGTELSVEEKDLFYQFLLKYGHLFAQDSTDLGRTDKVQHSIYTGEARPVRQPVRRLPPQRREEVRKLLEEMLKKDVIQESSSPWASPIVLVTKSDGSTRFCVDYRRLNSLTRKDAYPLPRIDDTLEALSGSKWFTTLDLISGYWQVNLDPRDQEKSAFCTTEGLFEFKVMPFGLCNAPATFQRLMDLVLAGLQWSSCLVYIDDVIIVGRSFSEHLQNLQAVFERLQLANLKLQPSKCVFFQKEVKFLGHIVSEKGVAADPEKTNKVASWPVPSSKLEVQRFLGLANYYRRFIRDFASIAKPLHRLTEKTADFRWSQECQAAFERLRRCLVSAPILAFPDFSRPFIVDTDASGDGIGAVLSQEQPDGTERVVAYASRVLTKAERRYCVTRQELLAVVVFLQHFRPYLLGRHFTLRTDHGSLVWLRNFKEPEGQLARWLEKLQEFDFSVVHRPGRKHTNADALSRRPCSQCKQVFPLECEDNGAEAILSLGINFQATEHSQLREAQLNDPTAGPFLMGKEKGEKPSSVGSASKSIEHRRLLQLWEQLQVREGLLYRVFESDEGSSFHLQWVVPAKMREVILRDLHDGPLGCHLGVDKTMGKLRERFYWPGYWTDVRTWCNSCGECARRKMPAPKHRAPLGTVQAGSPMQVVAMDILGPLPESDAGNRYILVVGDYFTHWMEAYPMHNQEATTVARKLVDEYFCRFSPPEKLHSDQGAQFESLLLEEICRLLHIQKSRTTPYHPQCDGLVERFNRTLLSMLAICVKDHPFKWEDYLRKVCMAYNTTVQPSTGHTPFFLMFGRQARMPIDLMFASPESSTPVSEYASNLQSQLRESFQQAREKINQSHSRQKEFYDRRVHGAPFTVGEYVWLHTPVVKTGQSRKFHKPWSGPYTVVKKLSDVTYRVCLPQSKRKRLVVHFDRLKRCSENLRWDTQLNPGSTEPPNSKSSDANSGNRRYDLELVDDTDELPPVPAGRVPRYPQRVRHRPDRLCENI